MSYKSILLQVRTSLLKNKNTDRVILSYGKRQTSVGLQ